ncbi:uncharacterized protein LOC141591306 [Silene latifolia]|uniref:uncharacterized protein LOC141591306 n=1 Tax=Silene latifolia TaxID=37657 RepID=UPI003D7774B4
MDPHLDGRGGYGFYLVVGKLNCAETSCVTALEAKLPPKRVVTRLASLSLPAFILWPLSKTVSFNFVGVIPAGPAAGVRKPSPACNLISLASFFVVEFFRCLIICSSSKSLHTCMRFLLTSVVVKLVVSDSLTQQYLSF